MGVDMNGLTKQEVVQSRKKYGSNTLTKVKPKSLFQLILESFSDPIIKILLIVLAIKIVFLFRDFDFFETIGILIAIVLASVIGAISEYASEEAFKNLEDAAKNNYTTVLRDKKISKILSADLVVGDIVILYSGEAIPADGIIVSGAIAVNESSINGEAKEKHKKVNDKVFSSTIIYDGEARMCVTAVGDSTLIGSLAKDIQTQDTTSPLKERLTSLAKIIALIGYVGAILVATIYLVTSKDYSINNILYALTLSVTVIVVTVPEGLPMMITLVLSSNMKKMLKENVLVRKLVGIETSGNITCLLTDKTGTLTEGILKVSNIVTPSSNKVTNLSNLNQTLKTEITNNLYYNNSSSYDTSGQIIGGNATDKAILQFIKKPLINHEITNKILFNSDLKYSAVTLDNNITYLKGAKEVLLDKCIYYINEVGEKKIITKKEAISKEIENISATGVRIILLAMTTEYDPAKSNLTYLGYLIIKDNIRPTATSSVDTLHQAGINVIMITGDNINTAISIAKETNIITSKSDLALTSLEFNKLSNEEIIKIYPHLKVIARALPNDKSRLVKILKDNNQIVGMTGDGINDAGALKLANVGFAMGSGTEVSKEAADIIILDNNIKSITKAVLFGRTIFKSIRKFIIFQLTVNICAMIMAIIGPILNLGTPVTVIQMLWINMIMDTLAGIAFAHEPPLEEYMAEPPKTKNEPIINRLMFNQIIITGLYSSLLGILFLKLPIVYKFIRYSTDDRYLLTAYFALFIFIGIFNALNARSPRLNVFANLTKNIPFITIFGLIIIIQIYLIYFGGSLFRTYGLTLKELLFTITIALSVIPFDILRKLRVKDRFKTH